MRLTHYYHRQTRRCSTTTSDLIWLLHLIKSAVSSTVRQYPNYLYSYSNMASASAQSRANVLNQKIEAQAGLVLEDIERNYIRKIGRESFACAVKCYDMAGSSGPQEALEQCARSCQVPYQQSAALLQNVRRFVCSLFRDSSADCGNATHLYFLSF